MKKSSTIRANDRNLYKSALQFLKEITPKEISAADLADYLTAPAKTKPSNLNGLYERVLMSAQNANMKIKVIGGSIGGVQSLGKMLAGFSPKKVLEQYGKDSERLLDDIMRQLKPQGKMRLTSRSIWPQYCRTILSAAEFMARFKSAGDFYEWVEFFDQDERARPGLPLIISKEVRGMGFALACDFLKELGYANFGKPDVHVRDIFQAAGLCDKDSSDYCLLRTLCRVAENAGVTPYTADKVFWLIGSGSFYKHRHLGDNGRIARPKARFITLLKS